MKNAAFWEEKSIRHDKPCTTTGAFCGHMSLTLFCCWVFAATTAGCGWGFFFQQETTAHQIQCSASPEANAWCTSSLAWNVFATLVALHCINIFPVLLCQNYHTFTLFYDTLPSQSLYCPEKLKHVRNRIHESQKLRISSNLSHFLIPKPIIQRSVQTILMFAFATLEYKLWSKSSVVISSSQVNNR